MRRHSTPPLHESSQAGRFLCVQRNHTTPVETHDADRSSRLSLWLVESRVHVKKVPLVRQRHLRGLDRLRVRGDLKMVSLRGRRMGKEKRRIDDEYAAKVKGVEKLVRRQVVLG